MTTNRTEFSLFGSVSFTAALGVADLCAFASDAESFWAVAIGRVKKSVSASEVMMRFITSFPLFD
jgi:hypothetical protein